MLKLIIPYQDFNSNDRKESFYFNYTDADIMEMNLKEKGGLEYYLNQIIKAEDGKQIINFFKEIILNAYGEKSADGRGFIKSKEASNNFASTNAYYRLMVYIATDAKAAANFVNACTSKTMVVIELPSEDNIDIESTDIKSTDNETSVEA